MSYVYGFQDNCEDKAILGNKGANLVTMTRLGLPVPPDSSFQLRLIPNIKEAAGYLRQRLNRLWSP